MFIQNLFTSPSKIKTYIITNRTSLVCNLNHGVYISGLNRFINKYQIKSYYVLTTHYIVVGPFRVLPLVNLKPIAGRIWLQSVIFCSYWPPTAVIYSIFLPEEI